MHRLRRIGMMAIVLGMMSRVSVPELANQSVESCCQIILPLYVLVS